MMRWLILFILLALANGLKAQYDPLLPPNTFASNSNPLYWKNKKPHAGYWQQDVHYTIKAELDDTADRITGNMLLVYTNNSPDSLKKLVFHLYQNAFAPGSYASQMHGTDYYGGVDSGYQHISASDFTVNGFDVRTELDNSIIWIYLKDPILPGEKATIECSFYTQFGPQHGRMKMYESWGYKHYNGVHWYPRISVYDRKFGWTTDQHLGNEFYGDFGAFDVELTTPAHYVLDATGFMVNREQVLPSSLMEKLDIKQYAQKPWNEAPSEVIPQSNTKKTWVFHAENVHDFAWTADPTYRIGKAIANLPNGDQVTCYALAQEQHASKWQNAASYAAQVIELFSKDFGTYAYHKMIVADARDGMEYPMLTLDGGSDPGYRSLLAHEIGHNWFYGMLGNNETYQAALDEGFTQFITAWAMTALEGDSVYLDHNIFGRVDSNKVLTQAESEVYNGYYYKSIKNGHSPILNTHSDHFNSYWDYGQVYSKTATMLYNLQYVLGDELFLAAMQHYVSQWKFCHPYVEDFRNSVIQYSKVDLNWFFDQWFQTEQTIDYKLNYVRRVGPNKVAVRITRKGMQMPIDLQLVDKEGGIHQFHIPNTHFVKQTEAKILPKWYGWNDLNVVYEAELELDANIVSAKIDPTNRLADVYQLDNQTSIPVELHIDNFSYDAPTQSYALEWSPLLWYNGFDGIKTGFRFKGDYFDTYHRLEASFWVNTGVLQQLDALPSEDRFLYNPLNYRISYTDPLRKIHRNLTYTWNSRWLEGLFANDLFVTLPLTNNKTTLQLGFGGLFRPKTSDLNYLHYPDFWNVDKWNNFTDFDLRHAYRYGRGKGLINATIRSPMLGSDYDYGYLNIDAVNDNRFAFLNLRTRVFGQLGVGENWAPESQLYAAGGNPEQMMGQALTRSFGFVPTSLHDMGTGTGNYQVGGGLGLRGYNNYLLPEINGDSVVRFGYAGTSGVAINTEIEFDDAVRFLGRYKRWIELKTYLFADAGVVNINRPGSALEWSNLRMDAGVGMCLDIKQWGAYDELDPLRLRLDFPLFLNRPPAGEEYLAMRWLIGFQRAF